jgi:hypothetical protein
VVIVILALGLVSEEHVLDALNGRFFGQFLLGGDHGFFFDSRFVLFVSLVFFHILF